MNPHYTFPASPPASAPAAMPPPGQLRSPQLLQPSALPKTRPLSFSPQPRTRRHQHRRSGAMSEDLSATDIALWSSPSFVPPTPLPTAGDMAAPTSASASPQPERPARRKVSPPTPRVVGEPGQLLKLKRSTSSSSSLSSTSNAAPPSPTRNKKKRRSFVSLFRRSPSPVSSSESEDADATLVAPSQSPPLMATPAPTPTFLKPAPIVSLLADDADPSPRIDLNEALNCSFEHRLRPEPPGSPFSRKSFTGIQPVLEEEDESEGADGLERANSDRSGPLFRSKIPALEPELPATPRTQPSSPSPLVGKLPRSAFDQVASLAILEPKSQHPSPKPSPHRGHARKRSLLDRIMGR